jgi:C-terminal processing protease CtpA/Prc
MKKSIFTCVIAINLTFGHILMAQDELPDREKRIYMLSIIWKEMQYSFAFPERFKAVNLDSLYLAYLPKVDAVQSNYDYYRVLSAFMAHFNEAHTRIYPLRRPDDMPPLKATNIGKRVIVSDIAKNMADRIPPGSEIIEVNGIPVQEFIRDSVFPCISAATPHWKFDKSVTEMFYGAPQSAVSITVKTAGGEERRAEMLRNYNLNGAKEEMAGAAPAPPVDIQIVDRNIGYIRLTSFLGQYTDTIRSVFDRYLPQLRKCRGLIIDIRGNRGGSDAAWNVIAFHLISDSSFQSKGKWLSRVYIPSYKMYGKYSPQLRDFYEGTSMQEINHPPYTNPVADSLKLHQPLIVVSGQYVGSAAEDFLLLMKEYGRATVVGGPSVGCVGEPMLIPLSDDYMLMISAKKYVSPDGSQPNDTGILPDIEAENDYDAYLKGKDRILERALEELRKQTKPSPPHSY